MAGIDHVGLGSDSDGTLVLPEGLKDVGDLPNTTVELMHRGPTLSDAVSAVGLGR